MTKKKIKKRVLAGYHWEDVISLFTSQHPNKDEGCLARFYEWVVSTCLDGQVVYQATYAAGTCDPDDVTHAEINEDEEWLDAYNFLVANNLLTPIAGAASYEFQFILV